MSIWSIVSGMVLASTAFHELIKYFSLYIDQRSRDFIETLDAFDCSPSRHTVIGWLALCNPNAKKFLKKKSHNKYFGKGLLVDPLILLLTSMIKYIV